MASSSPPITQLLLEWRGGSDIALDELTPLVYGELRNSRKQRFHFRATLHRGMDTAALVERFRHEGRILVRLSILLLPGC
jgi:hypothetical protein